MLGKALCCSALVQAPSAEVHRQRFSSLPSTVTRLEQRVSLVLRGAD